MEAMQKLGTGIAKFFNRAAPRKYVYYFSEGSGEEFDLLGKKGANLCELSRMGLPVPPGFVVSTEASVDFFHGGGIELDKNLANEIHRAVRDLEMETGKYFGEEAYKNLSKEKLQSAVPLLLSVRSDTSITIPGMMDTVLNIGINDHVIEALLRSSNNPRWVYDTYRRFIQMYGTSVCDLPAHLFETVLQDVMAKKGVSHEGNLGVSDLMVVVERFKEIVVIPSDPWEQLGHAVMKVMQSWWSDRAMRHRDVHHVSEDLGAGVVIQSMVYGNRNTFSGCGVAFTRNPSTGELGLCGEYLANAEGDDVTAGIRTPVLLFDLFHEQPTVYEKLSEVAHQLERKFKDMQTIEFTVDSGVLYILESRSAYRTAEAAAAVAVSMVSEGVISEREALMRVEPLHMRTYFHPTIDRQAAMAQGGTTLLGSGVAASFGAARGRLALSKETAMKFATEQTPCILFQEFSAIDESFNYKTVEAVITTRGGLTSNLVTLLRSLGKQAVVSTRDVMVDKHGTRLFTLSGEGDKGAQGNDRYVQEGDFITVDGSSGLIYIGEVPLRGGQATQDFYRLMKWADEYKTLNVFAEATAVSHIHDAMTVIGADGIGMYSLDAVLKQQPYLGLFRRLILLTSDEYKEQRDIAEQELRQSLCSHLKSVIEAAGPGHKLIIQLPDHAIAECLPQPGDSNFREQVQGFAVPLGLDEDALTSRINQLCDANPLLGNRGTRMLISCPALLRSVCAGIVNAVLQSTMYGMYVDVAAMMPFVFSDYEVSVITQKFREEKCAAATQYNLPLSDLAVDCGVVLATPRSCMRAEKFAALADVSMICFDTMALTQLMFGMSADSSSFMSTYLSEHILARDPLQSMDARAVGGIITLAGMKVREVNPRIKIGMMGDLCNDPHAVVFASRENFDYVVCHHQAVPTAKLAAARSRIYDWNQAVRKRQKQQEMHMRDWPFYMPLPLM